MKRKPRHLASLTLTLAMSALVGCSAADPAEVQGDQRLVVNTPLPPAAARQANALFVDASAMGETRALLILRDGRPIYEAYAPGFGRESRLISWSMAKSVTAVLIGFLVADGRLSLDEPAPIAQWQRPGDPRGSITIRHLLHMSSGLDHVETADPAWDADTVAMLFGPHAPDMARFAESKLAVARPDERFNYSSATTVILSDIIARSLTDSDSPTARRDAVRNLVSGRLAGPLGMTSLTPEYDAAGTMIGGSIMHATARDYAKFGEFLRNRGRSPDGTQLLPASWVDFMRQPSPAFPGYGGQLWLNRPEAAGRGDNSLWYGQGPADLFAAIGHQGQFIIVSPSQRLTVVRLGISTDEQIVHLRESLRQLVAAL
jgi:CubicO group peptidase (beta-lactamase class C family)